MNQTIKDKRLYGKHVNLLSEVFSSDTKKLVNRELAYTLGIPSISWSKLTSMAKLGSKPIRDLQVCLMLRWTLHYPERLQRIHFPDPAKLRAAAEHSMDDPDFELSDRAFSFVLGRQAGCGHRWLTKGAPLDATTARLALMFEHYLAQGHTYEDWMKNYIYPEAVRRGVAPDKMTSLAISEDYASLTAQQRGIPVHLSDRLFTVSDLDVVVSRFGLRQSDVPYLIGVHQHRWKQLRENPAGSPVTDPSLAIFLRYLMANPDAINILKLPKYRPVDMINAFRKHQSGMRYSDKQIIALGGMQDYVINRSDGFAGDKYHRIISHFVAALENNQLDEWLQIVDEEARTRDMNGLQEVLDDGWPPYRS